MEYKTYTIDHKASMVSACKKKEVQLLKKWAKAKGVSHGQLAEGLEINQEKVTNWSVNCRVARYQGEMIFLKRPGETMTLETTYEYYAPKKS